MGGEQGGEGGPHGVRAAARLLPPPRREAEPSRRRIERRHRAPAWPVRGTSPRTVIAIMRDVAARGRDPGRGHLRPPPRVKGRSNLLSRAAINAPPGVSPA
ncbi:hypothetical protein GCM10010402_10850 [Actinomadura luteofluorescens]